MVKRSIDPVCGMEIGLDDAAMSAEFEGTVFLFCCEECYQQFLDSPQRFLGTHTP